ncbi:hypothetical protein Q3G72_009401 [Acer saccharum]|nr:hypothetical protein Q3G72_009401 [Acer saccharum]
MATSSSTTQLEIQLGEDDDLLLGAESGWVEARTSCDHLASLSSDLVHIPTLATPCNRCDQPSENWLCLCSLSYSDLSVWCFVCDAYLDAQVIPQLQSVHETAHILKFGRARPSRTVRTSISSFRWLVRHSNNL